METKKDLFTHTIGEQINAAELHLVKEDEQKKHLLLLKNEMTKFNIDNSAYLLK